MDIKVIRFYICRDYVDLLTSDGRHYRRYLPLGREYELLAKGVTVEEFDEHARDPSPTAGYPPE